MSEQTRSEQACPVCSEHTLALDQPPQIDVMGVQSYSDIIGMGDLKAEGPPGIICLNCGTTWKDRAAFDRGEPDPDAESATGPTASSDDGSDDDPGG